MAEQKNRLLTWMNQRRRDKGKAAAEPGVFTRRLIALVKLAMRNPQSVPDSFQAKDPAAVREAFRDVWMDPSLITQTNKES